MPAIATSRPDAVLVPHAAVPAGPRTSVVPNLDKVSRICDLVEPILGGRRPDRTAFIRNQKDDRAYFCSLDPSATLLTSTSSPLPGRPRYDWIDVGGLQYGYLRDPEREPEPDRPRA